MRRSPEGEAQEQMAAPTPVKAEQHAKAEPQKEGQVDELKSRIATLTDKIEVLEGKLSAMNDKLEASKKGTPAMAASKVTTEPVPNRPSDTSGAEIETPLSPRDPETGFVNDESVEAYKKAMILFEARKYPEAVLAFSGFLEKYADHPLAGEAQYYIGESYLQKGEPKLAYQEYQRVLTSYDRSPYVTQTLQRLAQVEESLNMNEASAKHRQMLLSMFPQSPAADGKAGAIQEMVREQHSEAAPVPVKIEEMTAPPTKMSAADQDSEAEDKPMEPKKLDEVPVPTAPMPSQKTGP